MIRSINGIYVTECMTFPRCGHTWLSRILKYYYKTKLNYCEMYKNPELMIDVNENTNLQKNHDFNLSTSIKDDRKYLIQIRNKDDCLNSYYKLVILGEDKNYEQINLLDKNNKLDIYKYKKYIDWIDETQYYYYKFLNKWVFNYIPNSKIVIYEHLKHNTFDEVYSILKFMSNEDIDESILIDSIKNSNELHSVNEPFKEIHSS